MDDSWEYFLDVSSCDSLNVSSCDSLDVSSCDSLVSSCGKVKEGKSEVFRKCKYCDKRSLIDGLCLRGYLERGSKV